MRATEPVFVDTDAWIVPDPLHERAVEAWNTMERAGAKVVTSVPVVIETFTYLDRKGSRDLAQRWRTSLEEVPRFEIVQCSDRDLAAAWEWLDKPAFHRLGLVDATSFVLMKRLRIRRAFAFDVHFAQAGFSYVD